MVIRIDALKLSRGSLEPHPRINILARQRFEIVRGIAFAIELREDEVPDFDVFCAARWQVVNLTARSTDSIGPQRRRSGWPEVVMLVHPFDAVGAQTDVGFPDSGRFIVIKVDGDVEPIGGEPQPTLAGEKLPSPIDRFAFEVVAEAEIAQHLKKGVVIGGPADVIDVASAQTLLATGGAGEFQFDAAEEVVLEWVHTCRRKEHRFIPARNQHIAGAHPVSLRNEVVEISLAEFVSFHVSDCNKIGESRQDKAG